MVTKFKYLVKKSSILKVANKKSNYLSARKKI